MCIPQEDAKARDISFDAPGREEFLAIAVAGVPDLPWMKPSEAEPAAVAGESDWAWMKPSEEEPAPTLDGVRLNQLWNWLQQQEQWRVFYGVFEVVSSLDTLQD